tara:strand:- start:292 stop:615 length:324 start_codon:yes stop_codon:yes gene_type:complete
MGIRAAKNAIRKLVINELDTLGETYDEHTYIDRVLPIFDVEDDYYGCTGMCISTEAGIGGKYAFVGDMYGVEGRSEDPYIIPKLEEIAEKHGCYWEWRDGGSIILCE